jgi:hypothetical protein
MTVRTKIRLSSTYRFTVPFYALSDGTTLTDLDAPPTLQIYAADGTTTVGSAVTCTKDSTGVYHGDKEFESTVFTHGSIYIWKMSGAKGGNDVSQSGELIVSHVV